MLLMKTKKCEISCTFLSVYNDINPNSIPIKRCNTSNILKICKLIM